MMKRVFVVLALVVFSVTGAKAQTGQTAPKVPAGTIIEPGKSMDALLKIYEEEIMGAVKAMPRTNSTSHRVRRSSKRTRE